MLVSGIQEVEFGLKFARPMVDVSDSETRKCRVHVSECVTRK